MEYVSGNIFIREMKFETPGSVVEGHTHNFDHTTYLIRGSVKIERLEVEVPAVTDANGQVVTPAVMKVVNTVVKTARQGHNWALIKAGSCHRLTALEADSEAHCVYSHRMPQGIVDWAGNDAEYDAKLAELVALAEQKFGQIVLDFDGWTPGYQ